MRMPGRYYSAIIIIRFTTLFLMLKRVTENTVSPLYAEDKVSSKAFLLASHVSRWILV